MFKRFLVGSNIWVGLSVGLFTFISFWPQVGQVALWYPCLVGLATVVAYSYMRSVQLWQNAIVKNNLAYTWFLNNRLWAGLTSGFCLGLSLVIIYNTLSFPLAVLLFPALIVVFLYPLSFRFSFTNFSNLRTLPGFKLILISATWTYLSYVVPHYLQGLEYNAGFYFEVFFRTVFIAAITLPFDVRDLPVDMPKLKTIPQVLGAKGAISIATFGVALYQVWWAVQFALGQLDFSQAMAYILTLELGYWIIKKMPQSESHQYVAFWVEGIPILIAAAVFLVRTYL